MLTSGAVMLVAGATNVAELVLAQDQLGGGRSGFALLVAAFGCGMLAGSLLGPRDDDALRSRYLLAIALLGAGLLATAAAPVLPLAMLAFAVAGIGNGLFLVTVRVLMQKLIPEPAHGRAFGLLDAIDSWGFGAAIVAGGALAASLGGRATFAIAGSAAPLLVLLHRRPQRTSSATGGATWAASGNHRPLSLVARRLRRLVTGAAERKSSRNALETARAAEFRGCASTCHSLSLARCARARGAYWVGPRRRRGHAVSSPTGSSSRCSTAPRSLVARPRGPRREERLAWAALGTGLIALDRSARSGRCSATHGTAAVSRAPPTSSGSPPTRASLADLRRASPGRGCGARRTRSLLDDAARHARDRRGRHRARPAAA